MRVVRCFAVAALALAAMLAAGSPAAGAGPGPLADLRRTVTVPGTAWWADPATGQWMIGADETVSASDLGRLAATAERTGARLVREPGRLTRRIAGGDPFYQAGGFGGRCAVGFNVRRLPTYYFLTSAHCVGAVGSRVFTSPSATVELGVVAAKSTTYDFALVRYTNATIAKPSAVNVYTPVLQPIRSVASGFVGQAVRRSGPTSGVRAGTITGLNATVNYADGVVYGLIRTNVCAEPGDSGGPLFAGTVALGMTSGGSGNCGTGGTTYFASASRAMTAYGVTVY